MTRVDLRSQGAGLIQTQRFIDELKLSLDVGSLGGKVITGAEAQELIDLAGPLPPGHHKDLQDAVQHSLTAEDHWKCDAEARGAFAKFLGIPAEQLPAAVEAPVDQPGVSRVRSAQQAAISQAELEALAPQLTPEQQRFLAARGVPPPASRMEQRSDGVFNLLRQTAQAAPVQGAPVEQSSFPHALPADSYFSPEELAANLEAMYGTGAAGAASRLEMTMLRAELALMAAIQGASPEQILAILGPDNPNAAVLAKLIHQIVAALGQTPPDVAAIERAAAQADWALLGYLAPQPGPERDLMQRLLTEEYGVFRPGTQPYSGGGSFGNQVGNSGAGQVEPGHYVTEDPSQAGAKALAAAQSQVGVREASGNNDGLPSQRYANGRREPWCADFVSWCFRQTGQPLPGNQRSLASVQHMEDQMKKAGKFLPSGAGQPKPGDIIFFKNRSSGGGSGRHVGIVEKVEGGKVYTIEGNSSNRVARRSYAVGNGRISGYGRP